MCLLYIAADDDSFAIESRVQYSEVSNKVLLFLQTTHAFSF